MTADIGTANGTINVCIPVKVKEIYRLSREVVLEFADGDTRTLAPGDTINVRAAINVNDVARDWTHRQLPATPQAGSS